MIGILLDENSESKWKFLPLADESKSFNAEDRKARKKRVKQIYMTVLTAQKDHVAAESECIYDSFHGREKKASAAHLLLRFIIF